MTTNTVLLLILSIVIAACLSYFQYLFKAKSQSKVYWLLAFLRFASIFGILLLLINPIISRTELEIIKTPLPIVVDNSSSISFLKANKKAQEVYEELISNKDLQNKFEIQPFLFDATLQPSDTFNFRGTQTQLDVVAKDLKSLNKNIHFPTVLVTDGNQTSGDDYVYSFDSENAVFPIVLGDTTAVFDLKISQLNVNKYAFYKNKFPVEVFVQYSGKRLSTANFSISEGNNTILKQLVNFTAGQRTTTFTVFLPADKMGLHLFKATISSGKKEKNSYNNVKNFAVEVLDQKTVVGLVSAVNHPDLSAFKRAIETNAQRKVSIIKPQEIKSLSDYNVLILYQPNASFKSIFDGAKTAGLNTLVVTGMTTDFNFLNQQQNDLDFKVTNQKEDFLPSFNTKFNLFALDNIGFDNFPPLAHPFGTITAKENVTVLLSSKIRSIDTGLPLLAFTETGGKRAAYLLGENSWKWRLQSHVDQQSFEKYDVFIDKTIQFLASNSSKKSLVVTHENFYNSGEAIAITAQFFNKNYEFDDNARLTISVTNVKNKQTKNYDLLKGTNAYQVNLDGLSAGSYTFIVKELNTKTSYSGRFEILDFDIEKQFVAPDYTKLVQLAEQTKGKVFLPSQVNQLIQKLLADESYKAIEKENVIKSPLIDWIWLLILIAICLSTEWFVRKYHGLL
ncbi:hypothetical protein [Flavobacterium polysaccharolyticum]|uniref:VWA domain-containing protein n=1 Tax=Flavobacterium polysaccharolyticum TaxID=3133148 RepID=A0ABU9NQ21_9FLAO